MFSRIVNNESRFYVSVPRKYVMNDLSIYNLSPYFLVVYCLIDRWRDSLNYYKSSVLNILEDIGKPFDYEKRKVVSSVSNEIVSVLEYMENANLIRLIKGDYHNIYAQFIIEINLEKFIDKDSYIALDIRHLDFVLDSKSSIKKGNLLQVLLYSLSTSICKKDVDKETGEIIQKYYQVYSESNKKTGKLIGISDKTVNGALAVLSGQEKDMKPLIVYSIGKIFVDNRPQTIPNIYVENKYGWKECVLAEIEYYNKKFNVEI